MLYPYVERPLPRDDYEPSAPNVAVNSDRASFATSAVILFGLMAVVLVGGWLVN